MEFPRPMPSCPVPNPLPFLLLCLFGHVVQAQDTLHVNVLDRELVTTDPAAGVRLVRRTVQLPPASTPVRRILLTLTYACPDPLRCGDWDYLDHVLVRPVNTADTFEVARMLTPYGGLFKRGWQFSWRADVTDLQAILYDSVEVIHVHHGYEPNHDRGWAVSLDLAYITGPPIAPVLETRELYRGHFAHGDGGKPIERELAPCTLRTRPGTEWLRIRAQQTGHGMNPGDGCGEFCAKWRSIVVDGKEVQRRKLWKECADNPLFPQAGTWIFDRADWCPGELQPPDLITVPLAPGVPEHVVDFNMEPYTVDSSTAFTDLAAYAVQLGRPTALHDAMITEILVPSDEPRHARLNMGHHGPRIVIANAGSEPLRSLVVQYGPEGGQKQVLHWHGELPFGASDTLDLEGPITTLTASKRFLATLGSPNGQADAWPADNLLYSRYPALDVLPTGLVLQLRTNHEPMHNALQLIDEAGKPWVEHPLGTLRPDSLYSDTLHLPAATYRLDLTDTAGDGLSFWYNSEGGQGHLRLLDTQGRLLKDFESDCGNGLTFLFRTANGPTAAPDTVPAITLFPRRTQGRTRLDYFANEASMLHITVSGEDSTAILEIKPPQPVKEGSFPIDISWAKPGRYVVAVLRDGRTVFRQRIRLER